MRIADLTFINQFGARFATATGSEWTLDFRFIVIAASLACLFGCAKPQAAESQKTALPAKVENAIKESEL